VPADPPLGNGSEIAQGDLGILAPPELVEEKAKVGLTLGVPKLFCCP
jgi:hypothetical protein